MEQIARYGFCNLAQLRTVIDQITDNSPSCASSIHYMAGVGSVFLLEETLSDGSKALNFAILTPYKSLDLAGGADKTK